MDDRRTPSTETPPLRSEPLVAFLATLLLVGTSLLAAAEPAAAQYFGRNKVQYDDFDFEVLETEHFRIHHDTGQSDEAIRNVGRMAERWYARLSRTFQHAFREKKPVLFFADQPDFQQTNAIPGFISQATGGVTEGLKNRVIMPFAETYGETDHVLGHELVHAFQYDIAQSRRGGGSTGFQQLPLWAVEGLAEYLSVGRESSHTAMWMRDAVLRDDLPTVEQLSRGAEYFPYRFGHALWAYIGGRWGDEATTAFYREAARAGLESASQRILSLPLDTLSSEWREDTRQFYADAMEGRNDPNEVGTRIVPRDGDESSLTISPAVSPDGSRVIYLSQREIFTVDLYVADARTGEVLGQLASANANPHHDALAYMNTSGTWSPDGARFAFATYAEGDNQIAIASVEDRSVVQRFDLSGVGAVYSLDWAPDGDRIVFSGSAGGVTDLFSLDLDDGTVSQLTDDAWSQLHPTISPDGATVAFSTDRSEPADLERLDFGPPRLGFMDLQSGEIQTLQPFPGAKHIDPGWSPDGSSLYFISDRGGFSDIYRLSVEDGTVRRVTRTATGVTGVTDLSPALTVARDGGEVLFSVFRDGGYTIRRLAAQETGGEAVAATTDRIVDAGILPPREAREPVWVASYLDDPLTGLPDASSFEHGDYDAGLGLDYVAQPTAGVGVDRFGASVGGGVAAFFSDMLGNHQLGVAVQGQGQLQDIGGQVAYANRGGRTNWSLQGGRIPYRTVRGQRGTGSIGGEEVRTVDLILDRTIFHRAGAGMQYPFSVNRRFEAEAGATYITFDRERIRTFLGPGGTPLDQRREDLDARSGLMLYNASTALVEDRSFMAFTSPVRGSRGRLEVEQTMGDLEFTSLLADYRRYFFAQPMTFAVRGFHFGRYGSDSESREISPIFLGFEQLVRGYDAGSFEAGECTPVDDGGQECPEFDRLIGSRVAVASAEVRIPLNGTDQFGLLDWGVVPVELSLFTDAGVAWDSQETPELEFRERSAERIPVFSSGVSARFNILGRLVLEAYYAYPFQRPERGWMWGFQVAPGW